MKRFGFFWWVILLADVLYGVLIGLLILLIAILVNTQNNGGIDAVSSMCSL